MLYKALVTFAGMASMHAGEVRELDDNMAADLLRAGYIEQVPADTSQRKPRKGVKNASDSENK